MFGTIKKVIKFVKDNNKRGPGQENGVALPKELYAVQDICVLIMAHIVVFLITSIVGAAIYRDVSQTFSFAGSVTLYSLLGSLIGGFISSKVPSNDDLTQIFYLMVGMLAGLVMSAVTFLVALFCNIVHSDFLSRLAVSEASAYFAAICIGAAIVISVAGIIGEREPSSQRVSGDTQ